MGIHQEIRGRDADVWGRVAVIWPMNAWVSWRKDAVLLEVWTARPRPVTTQVGISFID